MYHYTRPDLPLSRIKVTILYFMLYLNFTDIYSIFVRISNTLQSTVFDSAGKFTKLGRRTDLKINSPKSLYSYKHIDLSFQVKHTNL